MSKIFDLDPCQYYTTPGLSWDAMLKTTKIELELLTDIDMYNFIMKGIREIWKMRAEAYIPLQL